MTVTDFTVHEREGIDLITFGTAEKQVTIDITFIPATLGYRIQQILVKDQDTGKYTPDTFARTIALFTSDVDAAWIVANTDFGTLDKIVSLIIAKAFSVPSPEKN